MKRIISLVLTMVLIVACFAVPVMAEEIDNNPWIEILDYKTANNSGSNFILIESNGSASYDLLGLQTVYSIDVVVRFHTRVPSSCSVFLDGNQFELNMLQIDGNTYRLYADNLCESSDNIVFSFDSSFSGYVNFLSVSVLTSNLTSYTLEVVGGGTAYAQTPKSINLHYYSGSSLTSDTWEYSSFEDFNYAGYTGLFNMTFRFVDWNAYDYLSLNLSMYLASIESVSAYFGADPIPFEISYLNNGRTAGGLYLVNIRLDVRGLDFSSGNVPAIILTGKGLYEGVNQITVRYAKGYVHVNDVTSWMYWFSNLQGWLFSGFSSVTSSITNSFSSLQFHITDRFNELRNWVNSGYMTMTLYIQTWGQNISSTITSGVDRIVSVLSPNGSANDFNDKVQQQGSELENMAGSMGAVTRPDVSTVIPDIGGYLTVSGPVTLAAVFDPFWKNSYILRLLLGSLAVSVAFTVVYGGKK